MKFDFVALVGFLFGRFPYFDVESGATRELVHENLVGTSLGVNNCFNNCCLEFAFLYQF